MVSLLAADEQRWARIKKIADIDYRYRSTPSFFEN